MLRRSADARMEEVGARGVFKIGLVTDERDPAEVARTISISKSAVHGVGSIRGSEPPPVHYQTPEQFKMQSWSGSPKSSNRMNFEIEPGHWDFAQFLSASYPKPNSSDPGSRISMSTTGNSSTSYKEHSTHSNHSTHSTHSNHSNHSHHSGHSGRSSQSRQVSGSPGSIAVTLPEPGSVSSESSRSGGSSRAGRSSRARAQRHTGTEPTEAGQIVKQSSLASFKWVQVQAMIQRAVASSGGAGDEDKAGFAVAGGRSIVLGKGGFGNVYLGMLLGAGGKQKPVAVKILAESSRQGDLEFLNEVDLLSSVNHVNLVKLLGYCQEGNYRVLVYEYADEGSVGDRIHGDGQVLDWLTRLNIILESAYGLEYLHTGCNRKIIHRDIKSSNILLSRRPSKRLVAKVADFGLSKVGMEDNSSAQSHFSTVVKGTPGYIDPAYYKTGKLDEMSDIYSFGVVLLEMITGLRPTDPTADRFFNGDWVKKQSGGVKVIVDEKLGGKFNSKAMKEVHALAMKCVDHAPENRPDIRTVLKHLRAAQDMEIHRENHSSQASSWTFKSLFGYS